MTSRQCAGFGIGGWCHSIIPVSTNPGNRPMLARAVRIMRLQSQYAEQLKAVPNP